MSFSRSIRLDTESKQAVESYSSSPANPSLTALTSTIESEFAQLPTNTFSYELKAMCEKISTQSIIKSSDVQVRDYELICRLTEIDMPIVPPLKMKLTLQYPNDPPEILSLISSALHTMPAKLENSGRTRRSRSYVFTDVLPFRWSLILRGNISKFCVFLI